MGAMTVASGTSRASGRRDHELHSTRRRKAEGRLARERTRNARLALGGFVALATLLTLGIRTTWTPPPVTSLRVPTDAASRKFAQSHVGRLFFSSLDGAICREMQFNNDTGRFSEDRTTRCDDTEPGNESPDSPATDSRNRGLSIRNGFISR
jgi:hypothetical protein